jgi:hypothetical protein
MDVAKTHPSRHKVTPVDGNYNDKVKEDEMDRACDMCGREEEWV